MNKPIRIKVNHDGVSFKYLYKGNYMLVRELFKLPECTANSISALSTRLRNNYKKMQIEDILKIKKGQTSNNGIKEVVGSFDPFTDKWV